MFNGTRCRTENGGITTKSVILASGLGHGHFQRLSFKKVLELPPRKKGRIMFELVEPQYFTALEVSKLVASSVRGLERLVDELQWLQAEVWPCSWHPL